MKTIRSIAAFFAAVPSLLFSAHNQTPIRHLRTETVKVYGNCDKCKKNIEAAAYTKHVSQASWSKDSKTAILSYDSTKTSTDAILKKIALAGYDNQNYLAPDAAYSHLDECCQYERRKTTTVAQHDASGRHTASVTSTSSEKQEAEKNLFAPVYDAYFSLKDALIKSNGAETAARAKELYKAIHAIPMDQLNTAQHGVWMKYMKDLSYNAEHIKGTTETEHQREHFVKLSAAMYEVMKNIKAGYPVYVDHCPMYNSGKGGDWLSKESGIKNPYYGSQMLSCGNTKEVIK